MEFIPSMKLYQSSAAVGEPDGTAAINQDRLIALSSWMMILGTIRAICAFADLASGFLDATRGEPVSWQMLGRFIDENQPFLAFGVAWPLVLGFIVRRTRWPELLPAAGITFLFLSIGGLLEVVAEWKHATGHGITFGSFHLKRLDLVKPGVSAVILGVLGVSQLAVECATGLRCLVLYRQLRRSGAPAREPTRQEGARRARLGRLAIYVSVGFLMLMIRLPVWSTYLEIINDSRIVREFVLKTDVVQPNRPRRAIRLSKDEQRLRDFQQMLTAALIAHDSGNFPAAKENYLELLSQAESRGQIRRSADYDALIAQAENNLAWLLATCPKTDVRDSRQAVKHARAAVEIEPKTGNYWNTLGVALYRNGEWDLAHDALDRSIQLRGHGGDSFDWFFLAMIDQRQGRKEKARELYENAVKWYHDQPTTNDEELYRFQREAAEALGLPKPAAHPDSPARRNMIRPASPSGRAIFPNRRRRPPKAGPDADSSKERTLLPE